MTAAGTSGAVTSSGLRVQPRTPAVQPTPPGPIACVAASITLDYAIQDGKQMITVRFLDGGGNQVTPIGCADPAWNASPDGAVLQPMVSSSRDLIQAELMIVGGWQTYRVTAKSGTMEAFIDVPPQRTTAACAAQSLSLAYNVADGRQLITVSFLDGNGNQVSPVGCANPTWSASPEGAILEPVGTGSRDLFQAELLVVGPRQTYTVTAKSGTMEASIDVPPGRGAGLCTAATIKLTLDTATRKPLLTAQLLDAIGAPVPPEDCSPIQWSISPDGAYVRPLSAGPVGTAQVELIVVGMNQTYRVTATSGALTASIDVY